QRLHQLLQPGIARVAERGDDLLDEFLLAGLLRGRQPGHLGALLVHAHPLFSSSPAISAGSAPAHAACSRRRRSPAVTGLGVLGGAAAPAPGAAGIRHSASGIAGPLNASTYGSTTACVWACGRLYAPPRTWQILWCSPDPADANAAADRYAAYSARSRPSSPAGSATTSGRPARSARIPSPASARLIGWA